MKPTLRQIRSDVHRLAMTEAQLRSSFLTDPGALELASSYRRMREEAERALERTAPRVDSLSLFEGLP